VEETGSINLLVEHDKRIKINNYVIKNIMERYQPMMNNQEKSEL